MAASRPPPDSARQTIQGRPFSCPNDGVHLSLAEPVQERLHKEPVMFSVRTFCLWGALSCVAPLSASQPSNPYREVPGFAKLPEGEIWGHAFGVAVDSHANLWVLERCGGSS